MEGSNDEARLVGGAPDKRKESPAETPLYPPDHDYDWNVQTQQQTKPALPPSSEQEQPASELTENESSTSIDSSSSPPPAQAALPQKPFEEGEDTKLSPLQAAPDHPRLDEEIGGVPDYHEPSSCPLVASAIVPAEDNAAIMDAKPEQAKEQASEEGLPGGEDLTNLSAGDELVQATLIRDVDDSSEHSAGDLFPPSTALLRDATSGAIAVESDVAVVEAKPVEPVPAKTMSRKLICAVMGMLLLVIAALSVGFVVSAQRQGDSSSDASGDSESMPSNATITPSATQEAIQTSSPTATPIPVLQRLRAEGGPLRCGVMPGPGLFYRDENGEPQGFDASLCAAIAAAATGDPKNVEYVETKFQDAFESLHLGRFDIVSAGITHTMERQVYQPAAKAGFAFTVPYLYQGMQLAGDPELVDCGDRGLEKIAACVDIQVCVIDQSTHEQMLSSYLPGQKLIAIDNRDQLRKSLADGTCNVIAHEGYNLAESLVRAAGFEGDYKVGVTLFSKEPLAMVTSPDDPQFSDFANSVVQALVVAEANGIERTSADMFQQTDAFGEEYKEMFRHSIAAGGNYGELYARFLEPYSKRQGLNLINYGDSNTTGLLYSHPFGSIASEGGKSGETLESVKLRGRLRCGVRVNRAGFAELQLNNETGAFISAHGLEIDYCRAVAGSIFEANGDKVDFINVVDQQDGYVKLAAGDLDLLAGATWSFLNDVRVPEVNEGFSFTQPYFYGSEENAVSEGNLCLATKQGDHLWSSFVYWIAAAIVQAEETKIKQGMSNSMPPIYLFGEDLGLMLQDAILTVGNYQEVYDRNLESIVPRSGRNLLNGNVGEQLYPLPGMMDL